MTSRTRRSIRLRSKRNTSVSDTSRVRSLNSNHGIFQIIQSISFRFGFGIMILLIIACSFYLYDNGSNEEPEEFRKLTNVITPLNASRMMDLAQFQGEHKESLYWGTYRPHVYLGIRARTPKSVIAGLMWNSRKSDQYFLRHVCLDSDDLTAYGWTDHNGRDYGRQNIIDQNLSLTTSFLKRIEHGSGYGGDWAVRISTENEKVGSDDENGSNIDLFFYIADEGDNTLSVGTREYEVREGVLLAFGSHDDTGSWELHLKSHDNLEIHHAGFRTPHMHNLTELVQGALSINERMFRKMQLPDELEDSANILVFQISGEHPLTVDIAFVSGVNLKDSRVEERVDILTGTKLTSQLKKKQEQFEEKFMSCFNLKDKIDSEAVVVGRAAVSNMLGGIGYFYGQSNISVPERLKEKDGNSFLLYWPAAIFTAVPCRTVFPRGFLWDEGFHQLIVWRWDIRICMDIVGHWLDLINKDGWIPREQILGAEARSKIHVDYIPQYPSNGNPPTLLLLLHDMISSARMKRFSLKEANEIKTFLGRAYTRLDAWFEWFNTTQRGKDDVSFYWHGRDSRTATELNPQTLTSGLDDYPRASHPSDDERHLDLRCWMLLAANCMNSISKFLETKDGLEKDYHKMAEKLSSFQNLNQMHLHDDSGIYFDFGNHTEKVHLSWRRKVKGSDTVKIELLRETFEQPQLSLVPHVGYVNLFPFIMGMIPSTSWILEKQLDLISNESTLWTDYGLRSLSKTSSLYMTYNTEHDAPYWRGSIWINLNYLVLSALNHYSQVDGPYKEKSLILYKKLRSNLVRNIVQNYQRTGYLWEQYDQENEGKGKGAKPFTGWTALVLLIMAEEYPKLQTTYSK